MRRCSGSLAREPVERSPGPLPSPPRPGAYPSLHSVCSPHLCLVFTNLFSCSLPPYLRLAPASSVTSSSYPMSLSSLPPSRAHPFHARLVANKRVTSPNHFQDVRLITLDISAAKIRYRYSCVCVGIQASASPLLPGTRQEMFWWFSRRTHPLQ